MDIPDELLETTIYVYGKECYFSPGYYSNDRLGILLLVIGSNEPMATLTVNLDDEKLEDGEFFVKTWSENEPIAKICMETGLFFDTGKRVDTGFVQAEVWRFNDGS